MPFARWLSYLWPVRVQRHTGLHMDLELTWERGRLVVNSANANQSHGSLHRIWEQALADAEVPARQVGKVLILGFGAGSAASILRKMKGPTLHITGVDHEPVMLDLARAHFAQLPSEHLVLITEEAFRFVRSTAATFDLILVDLFRDNEPAPLIADPGFLEELRRLLQPGGMVLVNTMRMTDNGRRTSALSLAALRQCFGTVIDMRYEEHNSVFMGL